MNGFFRRLRWFAQRPGREAELREELEFHLSEEAEERRLDGCTDDEARFAARRDLGNLGQVRESTRESWGWAGIEQIARDAAYGVRQLRRSPGFSAIAIATLALGIGGITAMFSAVNGVLIRPLPYADSDRLVMIWDGLKKESGDVGKHASPAPAEYLEWRRMNTVFTDLAVTQPGTASLSGDTVPEQVPARKATGNLWSVLGVKPRIGRTFTEEEDTNGSQVAVISYGLWMRRYGGSESVAGRKILINGLSYEVVGVMPRDFYFMPARDIDVWMPATFPAWMRKNMTWHDSQVVARLKPGVTRERAQSAMDALSMQITAKDFRGAHSVTVGALREELAGKTQTELLVLLYASAALLLIACVNLANLLLSRSAVRSREVAVRAALGAGRGRLIAQFLTESLVLAGLGTIAGLLLALPAMRFLELLVPETMGVIHLTLDWRVLSVSGTAAIGAALIFGLLPALRGSRTDPQTGLREGGRGATGGAGHGFQYLLIVIETSLAVVLLASGGVLLQTFEHLRNAEFGIRTEKLLTFETPLTRYPEFDRRVTFVNTELEQVRAIPGVLSAAAISLLPMGGNNQATFYLFAGQPRDRLANQVAQFRVVTRDYFSTAGASLREGRFFDISDRRSESPVVIVNETFAKRNFPGASPIGARFLFGQTGDKDYWYRIVGVVNEIHEASYGEDEKPVVYLLHEQTDQWTTKGAQPASVVVRTAVEPASIIPAIRRAIQAVDRDQPTWKIQTLEEILSSQLTTPRQSATLMIAFALLALLLASLGIYGVLSYAVTQRTNEIGIRMALGATSGEILFSFGKRGLVLTLGGLTVGLGLTVVAVRLMKTLLYGLQPDYTRVVMGVSAILLIVAALACFVPARRASWVDPVVALRNE